MRKLNASDLNVVNAAGIITVSVKGLNKVTIAKRVIGTGPVVDTTAHGITVKSEFTFNKDLLSKASDITVHGLFDDD